MYWHQGLFKPPQAEKGIEAWLQVLREETRKYRNKQCPCRWRSGTEKHISTASSNSDLYDHEQVKASFSPSINWDSTTLTGTKQCKI